MNWYREALAADIYKHITGIDMTENLEPFKMEIVSIACPNCNDKMSVPIYQAIKPNYTKAHKRFELIAQYAGHLLSDDNYQSSIKLMEAAIFLADEVMKHYPEEV